MRFAVLDPAGEQISDPDTGKIIGSLQRPKVQLEVVQVTDQMSVAKTYQYRTVNIGGTGSGFAQLGDVARLFTPRHEVKRYETLKSSEAEWEPLTEEQSIVKVGDPVIQIDVTDQDEVGGIISDSAVDSVAELPDDATSQRRIEGRLN